MIPPQKENPFCILGEWTHDRLELNIPVLDELESFTVRTEYDEGDLSKAHPHIRIYAVMKSGRQYFLRQFEDRSLVWHELEKYVNAILDGWYSGRRRS